MGNSQIGNYRENDYTLNYFFLKKKKLFPYQQQTVSEENAQEAYIMPLLIVVHCFVDSKMK